jgi:hypothetical protein
MTRLLAVVTAVTAMTIGAACGDEVHHGTFAAAVIGTWGRSADLCQSQDKSNVVISDTKYTDADGTCRVDTVIERAGAQGPYYAARALCDDPAQPGKDRAMNVILRPEPDNKMSIGKSFTDLAAYQRCQAH